MITIKEDPELEGAIVDRIISSAREYPLIKILDCTNPEARATRRLIQRTNETDPRGIFIVSWKRFLSGGYREIYATAFEDREADIIKPDYKPTEERLRIPEKNILYILDFCIGSEGIYGISASTEIESRGVKISHCNSALARKIESALSL